MSIGHRPGIGRRIGAIPSMAPVRRGEPSDPTFKVRRPDRTVEEILEELGPFQGQEALGVILDPLQGERLVADAHDLALVGPGHDLERRRGACPGWMTRLW